MDEHADVGATRILAELEGVVGLDAIGGPEVTAAVMEELGIATWSEFHALAGRKCAEFILAAQQRRSDALRAVLVPTMTKINRMAQSDDPATRDHAERARGAVISVFTPKLDELASDLEQAKTTVPELLSGTQVEPATLDRLMGDERRRPPAHTPTSRVRLAKSRARRPPQARRRERRAHRRTRVTRAGPDDDGPGEPEPPGDHVGRQHRAAAEELALLHELRRTVIVAGWPDDVISEAYALGLALDRAIASRKAAAR